MDFLHRHCASLKHLELYFVTLRGKEWKEVYNAMPDCLHLESFRTDEPIYGVRMERGTRTLSEFVGTPAQSRELAIAMANES